jgi:hypothetical protein
VRQQPPIENTLGAAAADGEGPRRKLVNWNEYDGPYFGARLGGGFLYDYSAYSQSSERKDQLPSLEFDIGQPERRLRT